MVEIIRPRIGILASGGGTTAEAFIHATQDGRVDADVAMVICSKPREQAGIYDRIDRLNKQYGLRIPYLHISRVTHPGGPVERGQTDQESAMIADILKHYDIGFVALMGYMRIVRGRLLDAYGWHEGTDIDDISMINTHPGPLPETADTYGLGTSQRVIDLGMAQSKVTVHAVSAGVDKGPIIGEKQVDVLPEDTAEELFARVQKAEKEFLPDAVQNFLHS